MKILIEFWNLSASMGPWLLLGLIAAGLIGLFVNRSWIEKHLSGPGLKPVLKAALFGVPMPLCSCSVIPTGLGLYKQGASKGATISFMISTPQTGVDSMVLTSAAFGWPFTLFKIFVAVLSGCTGGILAGNQAESHEDAQSTTLNSPIKRFIHTTFVDLPGALAVPFTLGLMANILISSLISPGYLGSLTANAWWVPLAVLLVSVPLYVCTTASIPIALMLLDQGLSAGSVLVFLLAGPATNMATLSVIGKTMGKRALFSYLLPILFFSLTASLLSSSLSVLGSMVSEHQHQHLGWFDHLCTTILFLTFLPAYIKTLRSFLPKAPVATVTGKERHFMLQGLSCQGCVMKSQTALKNAGIGVTAIDVTTLELEESADINQVQNLFNKLGFTASPRG